MRPGESGIIWTVTETLGGCINERTADIAQERGAELSCVSMTSIQLALKFTLGRD